MSIQDEIAKIIKKETERYDNAYWTCADKILSHIITNLPEMSEDEISDIEVDIPFHNWLLSHEGVNWKSLLPLSKATIQAYRNKLIKELSNGYKHR